MTRWEMSVLGCCAILMACDTSGSDGTANPAHRTFGVGNGCDATCTIDGHPWHSPPYSDADIERLEAAVLTNPFPLLEADPYTSAAPPQSADGVCMLRFVNEARTEYVLETRPNGTDAADGDSQITHDGACGLCSPLEDLAVYLRNPDLTIPVRQCAMKGILGTDEEVVTCLRELGFTAPCAQVWAFNAKNTRKDCFEICIELFDAPYNEPDGSLNACLVCDEKKSGPTFKAVAGRTRRNSGIPTAICRPCEGLSPIDHRYW